MYKILSNGGKRVYGVKTFMVDTLADIDAIPLLSTVAPGSTVLVAATSERYILNNKRIWMPITCGSGSSGGGDSGDVDDEIIYEGGDLDAGLENPDIDYDGGELEGK
jgi:hypothetical protein